MRNDDSISMFYGASPAIFEKALLLRSNMTRAEQVLWNQLSNNKIDGFKFRRQHPISSYIVDFYCHRARLVIEVDGEDHDRQQKYEYDRNRDYEMTSWGITIIRFKNEEVINNLSSVLRAIHDELSKQ